MEVILTNKVYYVALLEFISRDKRKDSRLYQRRTYIY